jgi:RNA polymerase sigma-70 factor (ECF subfamily)
MSETIPRRIVATDPTPLQGVQSVDVCICHTCFDLARIRVLEVDVNAVASPKPKLQLISSRPPSDAELCREFLEGNAQAFGELVRRHEGLVYRLVRRYARDHDAALELMQRAWLQAFEAARRALPRISAAATAGGEVPFRAWLLRIAVNLGKNQLRDARRWQKVSVDLIDAEKRIEPTAATKLEQAQREALTRDAVLQLPKRQREVFSLRIDGGLSFAEVAQTLGITEGNAKSHFHYAVKRLHELVQQRLQGEPS